MSMQAVIFDMDGVIIDSEALWRQAQIDALAQWGATASIWRGIQVLFHGRTHARVQQ